MKKIKVKLGKRSYEVIVGDRIINRLPIYLKRLNIGRDVFVITNTTLKRIHAKRIESILKRAGFRTKVCAVADTEKSKSLNTAVLLLRKLTLFDKGRRPFIIAFGGGVVGDLSGFLASIYKRGVGYISIPTTLLGQVDSSIGGKTALDLEFAKNLIGTFYQPCLVLSDISFLKTLPLKDIVSGLSEIVKYAILEGKPFFSYLEKNYKRIIAKEDSVLEYIIYVCAKIKADIVRRDEREEKGIRTVLNLGHTIAHGIEAAGGYIRYNHGQAVSLGLLCASFISYNLNKMPLADLERIEKLIKKIGLPTRIKKVKIGLILKAISFDKKIISGDLRFVLPRNIGKISVSTEVPSKLITKALDKYKG